MRVVNVGSEPRLRNHVEMQGEAHGMIVVRPWRSSGRRYFEVLIGEDDCRAGDLALNDRNICNQLVRYEASCVSEVLALGFQWRCAFVSRSVSRG